MLKLGNLHLDVPFYQAPLSGYSDRAMCALALEFGSPLVFTGLMLDKSVLHPGVLDKPLYNFTDYDKPVGAQLLGSEPATMAAAARRLVDQGFDVIDLNFACPAPKVTEKKRGGFLLTQPAAVKRIMAAVREAIACPLLIKLRIGYDTSKESKDQVIQICRDAQHLGIDALVVHGRTVCQRYRVQANWHAVAEFAKEFPGVTVIGSGDINEPEDAMNKRFTYGIDGIIFARGAIGNPWIFREARAVIMGEPKPDPPDLAEQGEIILRHFDMILDLYPIRKAIPYFRKFCVYYCRRHPRRKKVQYDLLKAVEVDAVRHLICQWYGL